MSESDKRLADKLSAWWFSAGTQTKQFVGFLLAVSCIRGLHIMAMPTLLLGMNPAVACSAKLLIQNTGNDYNFSFPPLSALAMVVPAYWLDVPPGLLINYFVFFYSLLYAWAFWLWLTSIGIVGRLRLFSCLIFLFLPLNNGYEGFDSSQTLLAGLLFLYLAVLLNYQLQRTNCWQMAGLFILSAMLPMTRTEYVVLVPAYLVVLFLAHRFINWMIALGRFSKRNAAELGAWRVGIVSILLPILSGLGLGVISAVGFRYYLTGKIGVVPPEYTCWTFLDGVPASWLAPTDESEFARRKVGIERFGHPSQYDYSLLSMIWAHPLAFVEKFVLNVPRWFFELGGRAQVLPKPTAMFAIVGLMGLLILRATSRRRQILVHTVAMIAMTIPMIGVMLYAEYLRPAFIALCPATALGIFAVGSMLSKFALGISSRLYQWSLVCFVCCGMEVLYFYSGANHPDAPVLNSIATLVDSKDHSHFRSRTLLDPYSSVIDSVCVSEIGNHALEKDHVERFGRSRTEPATEFDLIVIYGQAEKSIIDKNAGSILVWRREDERREFQQRIDAWKNLGFSLHHLQEIVAANQQVWLVASLKQDASAIAP